MRIRFFQLLFSLTRQKSCILCRRTTRSKRIAIIEDVHYYISYTLIAYNLRLEPKIFVTPTLFTLDVKK